MNSVSAASRDYRLDLLGVRELVLGQRLERGPQNLAIEAHPCTVEVVVDGGLIESARRLGDT